MRFTLRPLVVLTIGGSLALTGCGSSEQSAIAPENDGENTYPRT